MCALSKNPVSSYGLPEYGYDRQDEGTELEMQDRIERMQRLYHTMLFNRAQSQHNPHAQDILALLETTISTSSFLPVLEIATRLNPTLYKAYQDLARDPDLCEAAADAGIPYLTREKLEQLEAAGQHLLDGQEMANLCQQAYNTAIHHSFDDYDLPARALCLVGALQPATGPSYLQQLKLATYVHPQLYSCYKHVVDAPQTKQAMENLQANYKEARIRTFAQEELEKLEKNAQTARTPPYPKNKLA